MWLGTWNLKFIISHLFFFFLSNFKEGAGMEGAKFMREMGYNHREALSNINQNIVGASLNSYMANNAEFKG